MQVLVESPRLSSDDTARAFVLKIVYSEFLSPCSTLSSRTFSNVCRARLAKMMCNFFESVCLHTYALQELRFAVQNTLEKEGGNVAAPHDGFLVICLRVWQYSIPDATRISCNFARCVFFSDDTRLFFLLSALVTHAHTCVPP